MHPRGVGQLVLSVCFVVGLWHWGYGVEPPVRKKGGDDGEVSRVQGRSAAAAEKFGKLELDWDWGSDKPICPYRGLGMISLNPNPFKAEVACLHLGPLIH